MNATLPPPLDDTRHLDADPQCPGLLQRIDELRDSIAHEPDAARRGHWLRQLQPVVERARGLGCLACRRRR